MADIPIKPIKFNVPGGGGQQFYPQTSSDAVLDPNGNTMSEVMSDTINNLSDAFSEDATYQVGDYCIYENMLYKFIAAKAAGAWDSTKASATTMEAELKTLANAVTELNSKTSQLTNGLALIQPVHAPINTFEELFATDQQKNGIAKTVVLDYNSSISPDGSDSLIFVWGWCALAFSEVGGIYSIKPSENKWNLRLKRVSGSDGSGAWAGIDIGTLTGNPYRIYATQTAIGFQEVNTQGSVIRQIGTVNFSNIS